MNVQPTLRTRRLFLRLFRLEDAAEVQRLAGAFEIADTTLNIPHPYPDGAAEEWISTHPGGFEQGLQVTFAITLQDQGTLVGAIGLVMNPKFSRAEIGYWTGVPYWSKGYTSEAAAEILRFGFENLGLNRIYAYYLTRNPASGRVMQKIGMVYEGTLRQHARSGERFEDLHLYAILKSDWQAAYSASSG
jgi:[ribosomal protein S5]-alanine N-acetyltransferase